MVPSIARQSVIIKCNAQKSVLLGNYEFYYAAGLLKSLLDLKLSEETKPKELLEELLAQLEGRTAGDKRAQYLIGARLRRADAGAVPVGGNGTGYVGSGYGENVVGDLKERG